MDPFKGRVVFESAQFQSGDFAEELLEEMQRLRDVGDFSQSAMKKCKVPAIIRTYTNIDVSFVVSDDIRDNAYFIIPSMDKNHPFLKQMGISSYGSSATTLQSIRESSTKTKEASVDLRTGRVNGYFKKIKVIIVVALNLFRDKRYKTESICGITAHELGHAFTYFEYFGNIVRSSTLIDQASKAVMDPGYNRETKTKLLKEVEKQLGVEKLNVETTINLPSDKARGRVETVLISEDLFNNTRTESSTPFYDARNIEQLADQFCVIHGMGKWQAEALTTIYQHYRDPNIVSATEFVIVELFKVTLFLVMTLLNPFLVLMYSLSFLPSPSWYDRPKDRMIFLKRQMINNLRLTQDPLVKKKLTEDIVAIETMIDKFSDRHTIFETYIKYLNPLGRRMSKEEKFRKLIEETINNDLFIKAAQLENIK